MKHWNVLALSSQVELPIGSDQLANQLSVRDRLWFANTTNTSHFSSLAGSEASDKLQTDGRESGGYLAWQNGLILCLFSVIVLVSLCGNLLVCRTLMTHRRLRANSTNVLIGVLAISDLMMTTFNIPFTVVDIILKDWIFGPFFCTLVSFVQANSVYVSSFTMAVIAINRWRVIYKFKPQANSSHPHSPSQSQSCAASGRQTLVASKMSSMGKCCCFSSRVCQKNQLELDSEISMELQTVEQPSAGPVQSKAKFKLKANTRLALIIFVIWLLAALHSLPHTVFNRVKTIRVMSKLPVDTDSDEQAVNMRIVSFRRCIPEWPEELGSNFSLFLTLFTATTQYFIPLSCAGAIYTRIGFTIMSQGRVGEMTRGRAEQLTQKKRRRLLMLVLIVAIFALCWLPFNVYYLLLDFGITKSTNFASFLICLWLAMSSVCYNPFVYCWLNEHFQREAKTVLQRIKSCFTFH